MDKNCLNCFNFNDKTSKCRIMLAPLDDCSCFVPDAEAKIKQEKDCMRYVIDHGSPPIQSSNRQKYLQMLWV